MTLLRNLLERKDGATEKDRDASSVRESPLALMTALVGWICNADRLRCSSAKIRNQNYHQPGSPHGTAEETSGRSRKAHFVCCACCLGM